MIIKRQFFKKHSRDIKIILLLFLATLCVMSFYTFWGLTEKNIGYYLPRRSLKMLAIIVVSYCVGYSTVTFQTITGNRILTPSIIGLDSLYLFIQTVIVFSFGSKQLSMMTGYPNFILSIVFMIGSSCLLFYFLFRGENKNLYFLVLSGMIVGTLFRGMSTFMQVLLDPNEFSVLQGKMFATFNNINQDLLGISLLLIIIIIIITLKDLKEYDVIELGADHAINLGISYNKAVLKSLIITSILISVSTALVGPITFLGILVVSLSRRVVKSYHHSLQIIAAVLIGCLSLSVGTLIVEKVFQFSIPISVIINFFGGICFIYLLLKESKK
ncbi:iron chelate uptake ABC transporter family permease subunit [Metaclostridioides mangenotii]|uniref:iron chelate uptake ABC transporter family permease subunit n=1 Tax=Metaclostridioides mangenotii TaxID=1540 RepID=UPI00056F8FE1|nr:iron chelate uptake ABC transporter family permease subunit [Clostridioides mangenotii]